MYVTSLECYRLFYIIVNVDVIELNRRLPCTMQDIDTQESLASNYTESVSLRQQKVNLPSECVPTV